MNPQPERAVEKNIDDDEFDFFKQKQSSAPKENTTPTVKLAKETSRKENFKSNQNVSAAFVFLCSTIAFVIGSLMILDKNNEKKVYTVEAQNKNVTVVKPTTVIAEPTNNPEQPFNVDYSKLSKEDAERVKYALDQFNDIQKTLIETNKPIPKP